MRCQPIWIAVALFMALCVPRSVASAAAQEPLPEDESAKVAPLSAADDSPPADTEAAMADADDGAPPPPDDEPAQDEPTPGEPTLAKVPENEAPTETEETPQADATSDGDSPTEEPVAEEATEEESPRELAPIDPASYKGALPGRTTREQLHAEWGEPDRADRIPGGVRETYKSESFEHVRVTIVDDLVESITLKLRQAIDVESLVEKLHVGDVEPVEVFDDQGALLGLAYPERGMLFGYAPRSERPRVVQIVIEEIDEHPFLARAELRLPTRYRDCLTDIQRALEFNPECGRARWIESEVMLRTGNLERALQLVEEAIAVEPEEMEYRLTLAKILSDTGDHRQAIQQTRDVVDAPGISPLLQARAYCRWGDCLAAASGPDFQEALTHHSRAIKLAEPLTASARSVDRREAKQVLLDAYLGAAHDIGHGRWQQQATIVPKWLDRALALADDLIARERGDAEIRFQVYCRALSALAGIADPPDASRWIRGATQLGGVLVRQAPDAEYQSQLAWRVATALGDATEIEAARGNSARALELANLAMTYFDQGTEAARNLPTRDYLRGWVCYRVGAIFAIEKEDHKQAVRWFDLAVPLLESPAPPSATVNTGRHGETFVGMAVSYWELGNRGEALRLTEQGLKLMERAASDGQMNKAALAVPYANLAQMHEQLGDPRAAQRYADLATRAQELAPR